MLLEKIKNGILFFSLQEREKRALIHYQGEKQRLSALSADAIASEYIMKKTIYEHEKRVFSVLILSFLIPIFMGIWKCFSFFSEKTIQYANGQPDMIQAAQVTFIYVAIIFLFFTGLFVILITNSLQSINTSYRDMLIVEEARKNLNENRNHAI